MKTEAGIGKAATGAFQRLTGESKEGEARKKIPGAGGMIQYKIPGRTGAAGTARPFQRSTGESKEGGKHGRKYPG